MNVKRIYMEEITERFIENKGWTSESPNKKDIVLQVSVKYYDVYDNQIVAEGSEEFTIDRYNQMKSDNKTRYTDIKVKHISRNRPSYASKQAYQTLKYIYTNSTATIKEIELIIGHIANTLNIKYYLLKTK